MTDCNEMVGITANCNTFLTLLYTVTLKAPRVLEVMLLLQAENCATSWFWQWIDRHLKQYTTHHKNAQQDQSRLTGGLSEVATRSQNTKALHPIVTYQRDTVRQMRGWDLPPLTSQRVILEASAVDGLNIPLTPPPSLYRFLNAHNTTSLQYKYALTYSENNIFLRPPSSRTFYRSTYLQLLTTMHWKDCTCYSSLCHQQARKMYNR